MHRSDQLALHLARAFALTEIFPLRHVTVQEALVAFQEAAGLSPVVLEARAEGLFTNGVLGADPNEDIQDLALGLSRCGLTKVEMAAGLNHTVVGAFLDGVRIAAISGHSENLREMVAYHRPGLKAYFADEQPEVSTLTEPAGAIFASALGDGGSPSATADEGESSIEAATAVDPQATAVDAQAAVVNVPVTTSEVDPTPADDGSWDPPGVPGGAVGATPVGAVAVEAPEAREARESDPEDSPGMTPSEFKMGVTFFLAGSPSDQRAWAPALEAQAKRVMVEEGPSDVVNLIEELLQDAVDPEPYVLAICRALAQPAAMSELAQRLGDAEDEDQRGAVLHLAVALGEVASPAWAEALSESPDRAARRALVHALTNQGESALKTVLAMLEDPRWYVVRNAITVIGGIGSEETVGSLDQCLTHADARVRREAVMALAKLGGPESRVQILSLLVDRDSDVRASATMVAGFLKVEAASEILRSRVVVEDNEDVLIEVIRTLGQLKDAEAVELIRPRAELSFFSRPPKPIRVAAYRALGQIGTPEALRLVEGAVEDRDADVRNAAQVALESQS